MNIEQIINWFAINWLTILSIISYVISGAALIVKLTPTPNDDNFLAKVIEILKKLALYKG